MADASFEERTEQATPRKREEAKRKGQIARSKEVPSVMVLMGGMLFLLFSGTSMYLQLSNLTVAFFKRMATLSLDMTSVQALSSELIRSFLLLLLPVLAGMTALALGGHYLQGGGVFATSLLKPDWSKIDVLKGFSRLLSRQSYVELVKSLFKLVIVGAVAFLTIRNEVPRILWLSGEDVGSIYGYVCDVSLRLGLRTGLVIIVLAAFDYFFQRWSFEKDLRMSKQEVKEEFKQVEGDPLIKSRIRTIQRQLSRRRMMADVKKADVIITNPTHLAVALRYESKKMDAPHVVAKGAGFVAQKIIELARSHQVPVIENKPLAQALYKNVDLGKTIPSNLYHVVADILAHVYRLKKKI
jgi:flagellar biosynthesis protein FlhB